MNEMKLSGEKRKMKKEIKKKMNIWNWEKNGMAVLVNLGLKVDFPSK